jgi:hypothetical protein
VLAILLKNSQTPKPTIRVRIYPKCNINPNLLLAKKIEEQNKKIDIIEKATLHIVSQLSKALEDKHQDRIRGRERRY